MSGRPSPAEASAAALEASFQLFLTMLVDAAGRPLELPAHVLLWAVLLQEEARLVLRAPRGHAKTTVLLSYVLWRIWRHNRTATGWRTEARAPTLDAFLFSATSLQALELMARFRDLLLANEPLFGPLLPGHGPRSRRTRWSAAEVRLPNRAWLRVRAFGTSVRGPHPDLLLLDDALNGSNSLTAEQRDKTYAYFMGTLMPMDARQIVAIGTAIHQGDLLARLGRGMGKGADAQHTPLGFRAETYRAYDEETGETLWPERFPVAKLLALRDEDPMTFACEYQNDPRDDAASLFPYELTERSIAAGAALSLGTGHPAAHPEVAVLGVDLARSDSARADHTVAIVAAWDPVTGTRRVLDFRRERGLEFRAQVELVRDLVVRHRVLRCVVENNGFQQWLIDELWHLPATRGRVEGHRTGLEKGDLRDGVPRLAHEFEAGRWVVPSGDAHSLRMARVFQAELGAFGYRDGRPAGAGEHDDTVIAAWLVEMAIRSLEEEARRLPVWEVVTMEELGIKRYRISEDY